MKPIKVYNAANPADMERAVEDVRNALDRNALDKLMTYKVTTNLADNDFYTDDKALAEKKFQQYIEDYGDGVRLSEAIKTDSDEDAPEWDTVDSFDADESKFERGAAGILIELRDSEIKVYHSEDGNILFSKKAVKGDWDRIWDAIKKNNQHE